VPARPTSPLATPVTPVDPAAPASPAASDPAYCPLFAQAIQILGRRWSGPIVKALLAGLTRFSELEAAIPGLSAKLLSERLRDLEAEGIVTREVHAEHPVRIEYTLTAKGRDLVDVIDAVEAWAGTWLAPDAPATP
jgi:DNA-binding HxlR family transcriptional regulator